MGTAGRCSCATQLSHYLVELCEELQLSRFADRIVLMLVFGLVNHNLDKPFLFYFPLIMLAAVFFGAGSGYVATIVASIYVTLYSRPLARSILLQKTG
jgi:hypothetical protein